MTDPLRGAPGAPGTPGIGGVKGDPGVSGPAGAAGQPGQPGADGAVGVAGSLGRTGVTGDQGRPGARGATGQQGARGDSMRAIKLTDRRLLFIMIALFVFAVGFAFLIQRNSARIERDAHARAVHDYSVCQRSVTNTMKINATNDAFVQFLGSFVATAPHPDNLRAFIKIYEDSLLVVPNCGPKP